MLWIAENACFAASLHNHNAARVVTIAWAGSSDHVLLCGSVHQLRLSPPADKPPGYYSRYTCAVIKRPLEPGQGLHMVPPPCLTACALTALNLGSTRLAPWFAPKTGVGDALNAGFNLVRRK